MTYDIVNLITLSMQPTTTHFVVPKCKFVFVKLPNLTNTVDTNEQTQVYRNWQRKIDIKIQLYYILFFSQHLVHVTRFKALFHYWSQAAFLKKLWLTVHL